MASFLISSTKICASNFAFQVVLLALLPLFFTFIFISIRFSIIDTLILLANYLHPQCLNLLPENPTTQAALQALVCGHNFESFQDAQLYTSSGLIHLFVVSGSHLVLIHLVIHFLLKKILPKYNDFVTFILLFFYCAVCQFNPPIVRSFIGLVLLYFTNQQHRFWPKNYILMLTGLFCLALNWSWVTSLGLQMSWLAALAIEISSQYLKNKNKLLQQIPFFIFFIFAFSSLGFPQFSVLVVSLLLTPVLEYILFPLAFTVLLLPFMDCVFEVIILKLNLILSLLEFTTAEVRTDVNRTIYLNWILIFSLHILLHVVGQYKQRKLGS